jgi:hypothetical protein
MVRHAELLVDHHGPAAGIRDFRKHTGWYLTGFPVGPTVRRLLSQVSTVSELAALLGSLDPATTRPPETAGLPRGHTDGPRPVALPERWLDQRDDPTPPAGADLLVSGG